MPTPGIQPSRESIREPRRAPSGSNGPASAQDHALNGVLPERNGAMNDRQRDLFMWPWSRRRRTGIGTRSLIGALMGALGGLIFALMLGSDPGSDGARGFDWLLARVGQLFALLALSVPGFALLGWLLVRRVFSSQERMFQQLLASGVPVPTDPPDLSSADRWPAILVTVSMLIIGGLVLAAVAFLG